MAIIKEFTQDPNEELDYKIDWTRTLTPDGDTVASSSWDVPTGLTEPHAQSHDSTSTIVWVAGGTINENYTLTNHIVTSGGRKYDQSIIIRIRSK